jgi:opacity protein-like surface antigen
MIRFVAVCCISVLLFSAPAYAQRAEVSVSGGYVVSEGFEVDEHLLAGQFFDKLNVDSGGSFTLAGGVFAVPSVLLEFSYRRQFSKFSASGIDGKADVSELDVHSYHVNFVYHWEVATPRVRPYAFGGLGASHYAFGDLLFPGALTGSIESETRFSSTWGGGVKYDSTENIGVRAGIQWTPTYIKSTAGGYCDPYYGCWALDTEYAHQFEMTGGLLFRF